MRGLGGDRKPSPEVDALPAAAPRRSAPTSVAYFSLGIAGEGDQPLQRGGVAPEAGEAVGEDAAGQELAKLLLDELGQAGAVGALGRFAEEGLQVGADDGVEDAALRVAWAVGRAREGHDPT